MGYNSPTFMECQLIILLLTVLAAVGQVKPRHATLSQQKMCAEQAAKRFKEDYKGATAEFTSHYDAKMNVCYMLVHHYPEGASLGWSEEVFDAFEGRQYAYVLWLPKANKKYWEVPPVECSIKPIRDEKRLCHSVDEFTALIEKYFGIGEVQN